MALARARSKRTLQKSSNLPPTEGLRVPHCSMKNAEPGSAMDVSCTSDDYPPVSGKDDDGTAVELGYQGWAARRLVRACHRIFVNNNNQGAQNNLISTSVAHRGVIYWCLSNINADAVSSACLLYTSDAADE